MYAQSVSSLVSKNVGNSLTNYKTWGGIIYNVKEYGAKGDGVTDDTAAIQSAITAAKANNGVVFFPASSGNYRMSSPITVDPSFSIDANGGATIESIGSSTDAIVFTDGNYGSMLYRLPSISNFTSGAGLYLKGTDLAYIEVPNIANCYDGIKLEANTGFSSCLDNTIIVGTVNNCTNANGSGLRLKCSNNSDAMQGNIIKSNFFTGNVNSIYFDKPSGIAPAWDDQLIQIEALEGANLTGSNGIYAPNGAPPGRLLVQCRTFFGGFANMDIECAGNNLTFELAFADNPDYSKISINGVGNRIINLGGNYSSAITGSGIVAETASGSRASFNGGTAVASNKLFISLPVNALAAGATQDFYIYHPFTTGYSNMLNATPHFSQPLAIQCIEDASLKGGIDGLASPNQIHIRVIAIGAVTAGNQFITVEVGM